MKMIAKIAFLVPLVGVCTAAFGPRDAWDKIFQDLPDQVAHFPVEKELDARMGTIAAFYEDTTGFGVMDKPNEALGTVYDFQTYANDLVEWTDGSWTIAEQNEAMDQLAVNLGNFNAEMVDFNEDLYQQMELDFSTAELDALVQLAQLDANGYLKLVLRSFDAGELRWKLLRLKMGLQNTGFQALYHLSNEEMDSLTGCLEIDDDEEWISTAEESRRKRYMWVVYFFTGLFCVLAGALATFLVMVGCIKRKHNKDVTTFNDNNDGMIDANELDDRVIFDLDNTEDLDYNLDDLETGDVVEMQI